MIILEIVRRKQPAVFMGLVSMGWNPASVRSNVTNVEYDEWTRELEDLDRLMRQRPRSGGGGDV